MSQKICNDCEEVLTNWDYRYWGKHFCRKCYDLRFKLNKCSVCHQKKMINIELKVPVCKKCQLINKPCIRCNKLEYTPGKVTEDGPVCNSCSKYFREPKKCEVCHNMRLNVSNRTLETKEVKLICANCYNKTLPICTQCHKQRKAFTFGVKDKRPICKICSIEKYRVCKQCRKKFPAGMGRICRDCVHSNTLSRKTKFAVDSLSEYFNDTFKEFSKWLVLRRNVEFVAIHIDKYFPYFLELDQLAQQLQRIPTYEEIVSTFTVVLTRKNLVVTLFFEEIELIKVDQKIKEKYANIDMIERYLNGFEKDTFSYKIIENYTNKLFEKLKDGKTTVRSIRLALTPAFKLLIYSSNFERIHPTQELLDGYLWCYPGQVSAITGFINFLKSEYDMNLCVKNASRVILLRPKESNQILEQRFIDALREFELIGLKKEVLLKNTIEYLHEVKIPKNVYLSNKMIKKNKKKEFYLYIAHQRFYLPKEIIEKILD